MLFGKTVVTIEFYAPENVYLDIHMSRVAVYFFNSMEKCKDGACEHRDVERMIIPNALTLLCVFIKKRVSLLGSTPAY